MSRSRIIGTVEEAVAIEEGLLGRKLPASFRAWLLDNNGVDLGEVHIYPVRDERDTRKTWESLAYNLQHEWADSIRPFKQTIYAHLLPFADAGMGDFYCFDYSVAVPDREQPVVLWSHRSGDVVDFSDDFEAFKLALESQVAGNIG